MEDQVDKWDAGADPNASRLVLNLDNEPGHFYALLTKVSFPKSKVWEFAERD